MRDPNRIDKVLGLIERLWKAMPDLRLNQLIGNCFEPGDLYHIEDDLLVKKLKETYFQNGK